MKKMTTVNYWIIIMAWCMFLNNMPVPAVLMTLVFTIYLLTYIERVNYERFLTMFIGNYIFAYLLCSISTISMYFPHIYLMLITVSLNSAISSEILEKITIRSQVTMLGIGDIAIIVFLLIALILPDSLYSIFSKINLYLLISFIFLPYLIPLNLSVIRCLAERSKKSVSKNKSLVN